MLKVLLVLITCLYPLVAYATNGIFVMTGVTHERYKLINDKPVLVYKIKAEKQKEVINLTETSSLTAIMFNEQAAKERFHYYNGTIILTNTDHVSFTDGYYFNGQFVMTRASGSINNKRFSSQKIIFNEKTYLIEAKRILIEDQEGKHSVINYYYQL